ncbi:UDP-N-acetylmuramoylalanyl-D-glutamate--2,6-diaminopimelate ligase [Fluviicoccus keumensis]|uniref:UDP-N-acetylmuramoyl-L-alanyl-D-glutamate--2,6-diaminopimelate ligase n=1 Tax=Fluviicoccus keumensis TaxID=1435465 RepID=A0A4Q7YE21_9GAMM|nr:UDP-N-acetylmuramoyl-L-alanyl-D-glutamate--2,6-diaminopimelate ligase [Fluviicoccus keumensis]RZU35370.1 UDP-N-acetylmuramoylalanyl-D-glutamate--2,6-diaminopimelate ligase [Fluviicoccus keumensis]
MICLGDLFPEAPAQYHAIPVLALTADSRKVTPGAVFLALRGLQHDARAFIPQAVAQGAAAVLAEGHGDSVEAGVPVIGVTDLSIRLGEIAARFFGHPSQSLRVLAVTGTNGKTSTAQLLAHACEALQIRAGVLGTLGNGLVGSVEPSTHTTLDALQLQAKLASFRDAGANVVAMEASSHGLEQGRLNATAIETAIFTNLTRDHLDYHGDMTAYRDAKARLFRWPGLRTVILNEDDPVSAFYRQQVAPGVRVWTYSQRPDALADFVALSVMPSLEGLQLRVSTPQGEVMLKTRLLGRFNVSNLLAVLAGLLSLDIALPAATAALEAVQPVRGRMECFSARGITAVVDYAHTPDALEKVLLTLREHVQGQLWCVFGCGGDRDPGKRSMMGAISARLADRVMVTSDNPRSESPDDIIETIVSGIGEGDRPRVQVCGDRRVAIAAVLREAAPGDLVLVAGKGHEDYQEVKGVRYHFDDAEEVRRGLGLMPDNNNDSGGANAV